MRHWPSLDSLTPPVVTTIITATTTTTTTPIQLQPQLLSGLNTAQWTRRLMKPSPIVVAASNTATTGQQSIDFLLSPAPPANTIPKCEKKNLSAVVAAIDGAIYGSTAMRFKQRIGALSDGLSPTILPPAQQQYHHSIINDALIPNSCITVSASIGKHHHTHSSPPVHHTKSRRNSNVQPLTVFPDHMMVAHSTNITAASASAATAAARRVSTPQICAAVRPSNTRPQTASISQTVPASNWLATSFPTVGSPAKRSNGIPNSASH
jgi:hypothetical protein